MKAFRSFSNIFSNLFPLWTLSVALGGLFKPGIFTGISTSYFTGLLGLLMLSMGITLTVDDFKRVLQRPGVMVLGFIGCYGMMPALALVLSIFEQVRPRPIPRARARETPAVCAARTCPTLICDPCAAAAERLWRGQRPRQLLVSKHAGLSGRGQVLP